MPGIKIKLSEAEFQKLAEETGVSQYDIEKLYSMGLMKDSVVLEFLIRYDFFKVKRSGKYRTSQIVARIAMFYHVSHYRVLNAIYDKKVPLHYCTECGKLIRKSEFTRNEGLCDTCVAKSIELP